MQEVQTRRTFQTLRTRLDLRTFGSHVRVEPNTGAKLEPITKGLMAEVLRLLEPLYMRAISRTVSVMDKVVESPQKVNFIKEIS